MTKKTRRVFRRDRRRQLRLRLATKKPDGKGDSNTVALPYGVFPERELLDRIIERVRRL
jgi:hypothetical protein